jgi:hypothetical protein
MSAFVNNHARVTRQRALTLSCVDGARLCEKQVLQAMGATSTGR